MPSAGKIIDSHAMLGEEGFLSLTPDELLHRMDAAGVELAIARPLGTGMIVDHHTGNNLVLTAHRRIRGLATVNPWWGTKALDELARCRDKGAVGLFLDPLRQGFFPTEAVATNIYERALSYCWPILIRTGTYVFADVLAVVEVARRYPQLNIILGFGGYADMWFEIEGAMGSVSNLYLDASMLWADSIDQMVEKYGANRVLFGSAEPRNRYPVNLRSLNRIELSDEARADICHRNAERLFRLEQPA